MATQGLQVSKGTQHEPDHPRPVNELLHLLVDLSQLLVTNKDEQDLLRLACWRLSRALKSDVASISVPDSKNGHPCIYVLWSNNSVSVPREGDGLIGEALRAYSSGELVYLRDGGNSFQFQTKVFSTECHVPLSRNESPIGLLSLFWQQSVILTAQDLNLFRCLAPLITIALGRQLAANELQVVKAQLSTEKLLLHDETQGESIFDDIIGQSSALKEVLRQIQMVAPTDSTVLICGETGTGKELIARAIHDLSIRSDAPFVKLSCAAIPAGLMESELFGHERGAFTGAIAQRIGRFELASRGTIFLDEIGETPLELQPKLLRVLQEREFERLGNSKTFSTNARLIAATNCDLQAMVAESKFRADLYYRLSVFPLTVPPLNERKDDIPLLVRHFVRSLARKMNKVVDSISADTMDALVQYSWPGNIRELQNVLERAVILSPGKMLTFRVSDLPQSPRLRSHQEIDTLQNIERRHILRALDATDGVIAGPRGAAALLGLKRSTLHGKIQRLGVQRRKTVPVGGHMP